MVMCPFRYWHGHSAGSKTCMPGVNQHCTTVLTPAPILLLLQCKGELKIIKQSLSIAQNPWLHLQNKNNSAKTEAKVTQENRHPLEKRQLFKMCLILWHQKYNSHYSNQCPVQFKMEATTTETLVIIKFKGNNNVTAKWTHTNGMKTIALMAISLRIGFTGSSSGLVPR